MRGSKKFCQRGSINLDNLVYFSLMRGGRITISGPSWPASVTPFQWRFVGGPMMTRFECWVGSFVILRGSGPVLLRNPIVL